jgi:hypothetical protein
MTLDLFGASAFPQGFAYETDVLTAAEEDALLSELKTFPSRNSTSMVSRQTPCSVVWLEI